MRKGVALTPLERTIDDAGRHYEFVDAEVNREARTVTLIVRAPETAGALTRGERAWRWRELVATANGA